MSRPLSRGPQFDDAAEAEPAVDRARPTERIDLAQVEAQAGATEAIAMPPGDEGWGYLPPSTSTPQLAASPDQRSQYTQVLQPAPAAPKTMAMPMQTVYPEPAPPVQPVYASPEPAPPASRAPEQETWRELGVICAFHLIGLALEVFKVHTGSWAYPDAGVVRVDGVPVFSGFMYASVGSYICQAFRRLDLHVGGFRWWPVSLLAVAAYLNFFTHHVIVDLRWVIAAGFLIALWGSAVHFTVGGDRYWMPTTVAFILIGGFLWLAENLATALSAWRYPNQADGWHLVHAGKFGSWALLISLSFVLVAAVKAKEGTLYGRGLPRVTRRRLRIAET